MKNGTIVSIKDGASDFPIIGVIASKPQNARTYFDNEVDNESLVWVRVLHLKHPARTQYIGNIYPWFVSDIEVVDASR